MIRKKLVQVFKHVLTNRQAQILFRLRFRILRAGRVSMYLELIEERIGNLNLLKNKNVIDLGANVGYFAEACSLLGSIVLAVEPNEFCYRELNRVKRGKSFSNLQIIPGAIGADCGIAKLIIPATGKKEDPYRATVQSSTNLEKSFTRVTHLEIVPKISLQALLDLYKEIQLLKVDIEGAEYEIIDLIMNNKEKINFLFFEAHLGKINSKEYERKIQDFYIFICEHELEHKWFINW